MLLAGVYNPNEGAGFFEKMDYSVIRFTFVTTFFVSWNDENYIYNSNACKFNVNSKAQHSTTVIIIDLKAIASTI